MSKILSIFLVSVFSLFPCGKKIDKAFEALAIYDFFKAKALFEKSMKKEPVAASYGLSKIFYDNLNHFHSLDSAKRYIDKAILRYTILIEKDKERLLDWEIDSTALVVHADAIAEKTFLVQGDTLSVAGLNGFIGTYPNYSDLDKVVALRNSKAYEIAKADGSLFALKNFMDTYPQSREVEEAEERYELQKFRQNTAVGTEQELANFIRDHQESPYLLQAQNDLFMIYTNLDTKEGYERFVMKYPDNPNSEYAIYNMLELQLYEFNEESLNSFIAKYPDHSSTKQVKKYQDHFTDIRNANDPTFLGNYSDPKKRELLNSFNEGLKVYFGSDKVGFVDFSGNKLTKAIFDDALSFASGLAVVEVEGKMGVIDRRGKVIVPIEYEEIGEYSSGLIMAFDGSDHIYFNRKGKEKLRIQERPIGDFVNDQLIIKYRDKYGMINKEKKYVLEPNFNWLEHFENEEARFQLGSLYGVITEKKDTIIEPIYDFISTLNNGTRLLEKNENSYYFANGKISEPFEKIDRKAASFIDGYGIVKRNGKYGMIDINFEEVLPTTLPFSRNLGWGRASIKYKNYVKFFNVDVGKIGEKIYRDLKPGVGDQCIFKLKKGDGIIDRYENVVFQSDGADISRLGNYYLVKTEEGTYGLLNGKGLEILQEKYISIEQIESSVFILKDKEKTEVFDVNRMELIHSAPF